MKARMNGLIGVSTHRQPRRGDKNIVQANGLGILAATTSSPERARYSEHLGDRYPALSGRGDLIAPVIPRALPWALLLWPLWGRLKCPTISHPFGTEDPVINARLSRIVSIRIHEGRFERTAAAMRSVTPDPTASIRTRG